MAKQIKGNEIIEDGHLENAIKQGETLKKVYAELDAQVKKTAKSLKSGLQGANPNSSAGIAKINAEYKKSNTLKTNSIALDKQKVLLEKQLKSRTDEQVRAKLRLQELNKAQNQTIRQQIQLENAQTGSINKLSLTVRKYERELKKLNLTTVNGRKRHAELKTQIDAMNSTIKRNSSSLSAQRINIGNYGSALGKIGSSLKSMVNPATLAIGAIYGLGRAVTNAIKLFSKFDQANANLASILGTSKDDIKELTEDAKRLGTVSAFTATQITSLQTELAKLGFNRQEILDSTEGIQNLAQATGTDLAQSAIQVGGALRTFGLDASEAGRVADVLALSTSKSALDMSKLATALPIVGSTAKVAGLSIEETTSLLGTLSDRGIDASTSATSLRNIFLELSKQGLTWEEAMGKINSSTNKNAVAMELFGKRGANAAIILAENSTASKQLNEALLLSGGTAKEMADTQLDSLSGAMTKLESAWEGFILSLEDGDGKIAETIITILDSVTALLQMVSGIESSEKSIKSLGGETAIQFARMKNSILDSTNSFSDFMQAIRSVRVLMLSMLGISDKQILAFESLIFETKKMSREQEDSLRLQRRLRDEGNKLLKLKTTEIKTAEVLIDALNDENTTREDKQLAIEKLKKDYPELIGNIDLETASTEKLLEVKKALVGQILKQAIAEKKAEALGFVANKILDAQVKLLTARTDAQKKYLEGQIKEYTFAFGKIEEVATELESKIGDVTSKLDFTEGFRENSEQINKYKETIKQLRLEFEKAKSEGDFVKATGIEKEITRIQGLLNNLDNIRQKTVDDALGKNIGVDIDQNDSGNGGKKGKIKQVKEDIKTELELNQQKFEDLLIQNEENALILETELLKQGKTREEIEEELSNQRLNQLAVERDLALNLFGEYSKEYIIKDLEFNRKLSEQRNKSNKDDNEDFKEDLDDKQRLIDEANEKYLDSFRNFTQDLSDLLETGLENAISKIDSQIQKSQDLISTSQDRISNLQEQANLGNLDASESIKAERQRIANESARIEELEKKKRNLLITITALQLAQQGIQNGDGNALITAKDKINEFVDGLSNNYDGTETTLGAKLGNKNRIYGDKDTHVIKAHEDEVILGVNNSRKLKGMNQTEITKGALLYKNGELVGNKAVRISQSKEMSLDFSLLNELKSVKDAIKGIDIPQHQFNWEQAIHSIKTKKSITNNHYKKGGIFS